MSEHLEHERDRVERDPNGYVRPAGWNTIGFGRRGMTHGVRHSASPAFDNMFRLALGIILGTAIAIHFAAEAPEKIRWGTNGVNIPFFNGLIWGFGLSIPFCIGLAWTKRTIKHLGWLGLFGSFGLVMGLYFLFG